MYQKNFNDWNKRKQLIDEKNIPSIFIKEREVWWTAVGVNIGSEIDGKNELFERPVLIIKKLHTTKFLGVPLTSQEKTGNYFVPVGYGSSSGVAVLIDVRVFSSKRLLRKVGKISIEDSLRVKKELKALLQ
jgi:mRNA-degrading endonuclease toxin of MazEF toxin-antitoxin module